MKSFADRIQCLSVLCIPIVVVMAVALAQASGAEIIGLETPALKLFIKDGGNQHPDILPAAPECGGDEALARCGRQVLDLGYLFCLHDNYQDIYKDSPSWSEDYVMKTSNGGLVKGGAWAGGRAYLTCSEKALELARRSQNLAAVKRLTGANSYFIDTTYAGRLPGGIPRVHRLLRFELGKNSICHPHPLHTSQPGRQTAR